MGTIIAAGVALLVSLTAAVLARRLPSGWRRVAAGGAVWLGLAAGLVVAWCTSAATNLMLILLGAGLASGLIGTVLQLVGIGWVWRVLAQLVVLGATMAVEYRRGDMFAVTAAVGVVSGVIAVEVLTFAVRGAQRAGAGRTPTAVALLSAVYLWVVAWGLPNPGLAATLLVVAGAVLPLAVLRLPDIGAVTEVALGPVLAGAGWAVGIYAWLANASPAMVLAPIAVVGVDVVWTLIRRLVTTAGRARLASAGGWWKGLRLWGEPSDDLVGQRAAEAGTVRAASGWLIGACVAAMLLSTAQWQLDVRWLPALLTILLLALGWLLLQLAAVRLARADLIGWLSGFTALAVVLAVSEHLTDGRRLATVLPLVVALAVWAAAVPRLLHCREPLPV